ncbi:MAG: YihA family ribosome biogenesis GTP-binding protein [Clostridiaceae bacterium]|nr:YihA family ribosome biogenesis GTP-binding protein [Clostridiaceae bacterium]
MNLHNAKFVISAVKKEQYPKISYPEIALAGRSNVGKSSFINKLVNRKSLAKTSSKPGKTTTINFYDIDNKLSIVDLPGYGYAEVSKSEKIRWAKMIEDYLFTRENLTQTILIVDARHKPTSDDITMYNFIKNRHGRAFVVATKADKVGKTKLEENVKLIKETLNLSGDDIFLTYSAETGHGVDEALAKIKEVCGITS